MRAYERKRCEIAEKGNQRAQVRTTRKEERRRTRGGEGERKGQKEGIERKTKKGRDEPAKSGDEVSVVKSTVAAPAKNSN